MNWIWVILVVAAIGAIVGYFTSGTKEGAAEGAVVAGIGCGTIILRIFLALVAIAIFFSLAGWLFGI